MARKLLTKAAIFKAPLPTREVFVEEWGGSVLIRSLTVKTRMLILDAVAERQALVDAYEADQALPDDEREGLAKVEPIDTTIAGVIFAIVDEQLQPLFTMADYERFEELSLPTLNFLWRALVDMEQRKSVTAEEQKKSSA